MSNYSISPEMILNQEEERKLKEALEKEKRELGMAIEAAGRLERRLDDEISKLSAYLDAKVFITEDERKAVISRRSDLIKAKSTISVSGDSKAVNKRIAEIEKELRSNAYAGMINNVVTRISNVRNAENISKQIKINLVNTKADNADFNAAVDKEKSQNEVDSKQRDDEFRNEYNALTASAALLTSLTGESCDIPPADSFRDIDSLKAQGDLIDKKVTALLRQRRIHQLLRQVLSEMGIKVSSIVSKTAGIDGPDEMIGVSEDGSHFIHTVMNKTKNRLVVESVLSDETVGDVFDGAEIELYESEADFTDAELSSVCSFGEELFQRLDAAGIEFITPPKYNCSKARKLSIGNNNQSVTEKAADTSKVRAKTVRLPK